MRDPQRIEPILNVIRLIWQELPDWRLAQLIVNGLGEGPIFYVEDEQLIR